MLSLRAKLFHELLRQTRLNPTAASLATTMLLIIKALLIKLIIAASAAGVIYSLC